MRPHVIDVAATIVEDAAGRVLLAERTARQLSPGFWELPGGKIEPGETAAAGAARELYEETGLTAGALRPWMEYTHDFPTRRLRLRFFRAAGWHGTPRGREGQRLAWADPASPPAPLLPSNRRVLGALALPPLLAVAGSEEGRGAVAEFGACAEALARGARLLLVSEEGLTPDQRIALTRRVAGLARSLGARVLLEGTATEACRAGADGAVAGARELRRTLARPPVPLWGARCRTADDVARAAAIGADFALVAPVLASLDATPPAGWEGLAAIAAVAPIPVFGQGGLAPSMLPRARAAGAHGIAVRLAELAAGAAAA